MQGTRKTEILRSPLFLLCLGILLLNDWYLKYQFHNWLTGKLSDVAGLVVLFLFIYSFFPMHARSIMGTTVVTFIYWKSPASQGLIELWNDLMPVPIGRTIDYTDYFALPILLPAWWYAKVWRARPAGRGWQYPVILCSVFAITGTSMVKYTKEELDLLGKIETVRAERVRTYVFDRSELGETERNRIETLIFTLPDFEILEQRGIKAEGWSSRKFMAITYEFPEFYINTWVYHEKANRVTEYNITPWKMCDRQLATNEVNDVIPFLGANIEYRRYKENVRIKFVKLELCNLPDRKDDHEAISYFMGNILVKIENKFLSEQL